MPESALSSIANWVSAFAVSQPHVEGALHLAALAVAISAVYLGVDRIHPDDDGLQKFLDRSREDASRFLTEKSFIIKVNSTISFLAPYFLGSLTAKADRIKRHDHLVRQLSILSAISRIPIDGGLLFQLRSWGCRRGLPFLWYFRRRWDRLFVAGYGLGATLFFVFGVGSTIFEYGISPWTMAVSFILLSLGLMWIFLTAWFSYRLREIEALYKATKDAIASENQRCIEEQRKKMEELEEIDRKVGPAPCAPKEV